MIKKIKQIISRNVINIPGFRTKRKIVVFESDDWGSIRMPNIEAINQLKKDGVKVDRCHYMLNDTLESQKDLENLFEVLTKFKDCNGNHPKVTANTIVCNPDFTKIQKSNFESYFTELNTTTYNNYYGNCNVENLIKEGIELGVYKPQLHGREHVNISRWMKLLRENDEITMKAFDLRLFGISGHTFKVKRPSLMAVFDGDESEIEYGHEQIVTEAIREFYNLYGFKTNSFIAPNYVWNDKTENILYKNGINFIQGAPTQILPSKSGIPNTIKRNYLGKRNENGQIYLIRNVNFEPSSDANNDWVNTALAEINNAFIWNKPAIINTHRVNFVSGIKSKNADDTLKLLKELLFQIKNKWPDVEFMTSDELAKIM